MMLTATGFTAAATLIAAGLLCPEPPESSRTERGDAAQLRNTPPPACADGPAATPAVQHLCLKLSADPDNPSLQLAYGVATGVFDDIG
jgi:hypothetical protein